MGSNYPPGVTGFEPQIVGYDDDAEVARRIDKAMADFHKAELVRITKDAIVTVDQKCPHCTDGAGTGWSGDEPCAECEGTGREHIRVTLQELAIILWRLQPSLEE